eukprot:scaffold145112_cov30-Tisochrysis_lutea.AAC.7
MSSRSEAGPRDLRNVSSGSSTPAAESVEVYTERIVGGCEISDRRSTCRKERTKAVRLRPRVQPLRSCAGERVGQHHVAWEGGEDQVAHLDARVRNGITECEVIVTQELREIVQENQEDPEGAAVQVVDGWRQARRRESGTGPPLLALGEEQLGHERAVGDELEPAKGEARYARGAQGLERGGKGEEHLRLKCIKRWVGSRQVREPVAKESEV